ncbi:hypothetical protein FLAV_02039 [Flavobacteriales bacterium]|nr:hypothetical protein [Flavobacteriales bacterium]MCL4816019.1 alpha-2-macroglobulin [Flavobacteriales bacterium]GIK69737.1 MAG: alpha-2-macroglobulin [Bacteroidota bacterium]CAG0986012.1 hypothetical protein FLAV_02039 [Flavobacteriales bacterium]
MISRKKTIVLIILCSIVSLGFTFFIAQKTYTPQKILLMYNHSKTFQSDWAKVDSLEQKGLTRSALEQVEKIYAKAVKENIPAQVAKCLIYKIKFNSYIEEDSFVKAIYDVQNEADKSAFPLRNILQSLLAELYWNYYQQNMWQLHDRSQVADTKLDDIRTWDAKTLIDASVKAYLESLKNTEDLQRTPAAIFDDILIVQNESRVLRPFLYDFLAYRAVDFFMNEQAQITTPIYAFQVDKSEYFLPAKEFVKITIQSADTLSLKVYALTILQNIIASHLNDKEPNALIDADLKRLQLVRNHAVFSEKDSLYLQSLENLEKQFVNHEASAEVAYRIAQYYYQLGSQYKPFEADTFKWYTKKALEICNQTSQKFPKSFGAKQCSSLKETIFQKSLSFQVEFANPSNAVLKASLTYKNVKKIWCKVIKVDWEDYYKNNENRYGEKLIQYFNSFKTKNEWMVELPDDGDFQQHITELKIDSLPFGHYVLLVSDNNQFTFKNHAVAYSPFWISDLAYVTKRMDNGKYEFFVMNRTHGNPLKDVEAQLYYEKYNYTSRKYEWKKLNTYKTDEKGSFKVEPFEEYSTFYLDLKYKNDRLNTNDSYYQYKPYRYNYTETKTFFYTDRAIYRPGQTVYFKGIVLENNTDLNSNKIKTKHTSLVTFYDVNNQKVEDVSLTTNEYGTFSGSFTAPSSGLNGNMYISDGYGSAYLSVEEYKRPTFEVLFEPVKGQFRLNEKIKVKGKAVTYAGSNLDNSEVQFRVTRNTSFPYWSYYRWGYYPPSPATEVVNGIVESNDNGEFEIEFTALPDKSVGKKYYPTFAYTVLATVTDINGETHESSTTISVGYNAMTLFSDVKDKIEKDVATSVTVHSVNLNGQPVPAKGKLTIWKLKEPEKVFRNRLAQRPDKHILTQKEYYNSFPTDLYADELNKFKWEKSKQVFETLFNTDTTVKKNKIFLKEIHQWQEGEYVAEFTATDSFNEEVKDIKYFSLYSTASSQSIANSLWWIHEQKTTCEPGEKAQIVISSAAENVNVLVETEHGETTQTSTFIKLNNNKSLLQFPVEEKHRGGFVVHISMVKHGRIFTNSIPIHVPFTNKQLDLEFSTFRNKLYPGQKEEWKITVKDKKGDKVAAELLAGMYDASLDAFKPHYWNFDIYQHYYAKHYWQSNKAFGNGSSQLYQHDWNTYAGHYEHSYDYINWFGFYMNRYNYRYSKSSMPRGGVMGDDMMREEAEQASPVASKSKKSEDKESSGKDANIPLEETKTESSSLAKEKNKPSEPVSVRTNLNETAFFFPHLTTNEKGETQFTFTVPEALTRWKVMAMAHTKELKYGFGFNETVTQKELMVFPNLPRFFRESDGMVLSAKISNLSAENIEGEAEMVFTNPENGEIISDKFLKEKASKKFKTEKGKSTVVSWEISIPEGYGTVACKVVAKAGKFSDGEERIVPILTNRMLVTESMPLPIRGKQTKDFVFKKLSEAEKSSTLTHHKLTLEFTSNPAWYAIQALPYMMEYPYECAEQTFSRYYANSIGSHIVNSSPKVKAVFESWKSKSPEAFLSNLSKNEELKSLVLQETPWVLEANNESERKKRVALLFDLNKMSDELGRALKKLQDLQTPNGGWTWFKGMPDNRYITQHIVTGFGHLDKLGVKNLREDNTTFQMVLDGVKYLDNRIREDFEQTKKYNKNYLNEDHLGYTQIQYLYARSYFLGDTEISSRNKEAVDYYKKQAEKYWINKSRYMQGMLALALHRWKNKTVSADIIKSLKENAMYHEELGMYWKEVSNGYYWYQAPIETQALLIEAFDEVAGDKESVEAMKVWLLKNKQTNDWKTTKATTEACYALLLKGTDWLAQSTPVEITIGGLKIDPTKMENVKVEAGTGYFKTSWAGSEINHSMANVKVTKKDDGVAWGALYWQYFEDLDKITPHETPLKLNKKLFLQQNTDAGPVIKDIDKNVQLKPGDKIMVRVELRVDRDMEYVHMKDMRASGLEPINVLSGYRYSHGLGYYESTKDASTNFFFDFLPKGTYVFEYPLRVNIPGDYSNGITSIQCMYAPEFTSHSEGIRIKVLK